ncbi:MAG: UDP-N-acetylmuramoyl-tripeptide--D-alanyl-D-alanine ligase [Oscillospiraceae bacterium]|nr:UDP-N-acetylmuramoyl-tripeptide--D-alanyl-D-alanine ligase [Oscillospiraceae bacterium]
MSLYEIIITLLTTMMCLFVFEDSLHMFQLNFYKPAMHGGWLLRNLGKAYFGAVGSKGKKAKKPLVFTHRVIRLCITAFVMHVGLLYGIYVLTDYRVMLVLVLLAPLYPIIANFINIPVEKLNGMRYIRDAKRKIDSMPNLITIGVTGSYGKTSTKYYLHKLLSAKFNTLMTPESFNTTMGVVKTIRGELQPAHEVFVCEMGMMWKGDIAELCEIAKPKHAVITSIGAQHLETMKTQERITEEKFSITDGISTGSIFLNFDNDIIRKRASKLQKSKPESVVKYGVSSEDGDYRASDISVSENGTTFTLHTPSKKISGEKQEFTTTLIGEHNVQNIVGAIAVAHTLGIPLQELVLPVKRLECVPHRMQIIDGGGLTIIDDSFNSNPAGAKAALDTLALMSGTKILITPGMVALGEQEAELNCEFGKQAAAVCDCVVLIGKKQAAPIAAGLLEAGLDKSKIKVFDSFDEGMAFAKELDCGESKKVVLIENDLPDNY